MQLVGPSVGSTNCSNDTLFCTCQCRISAQRWNRLTSASSAALRINRTILSESSARSSQSIFVTYCGSISITSKPRARSCASPLPDFLGNLIDVVSIIVKDRVGPNLPDDQRRIILKDVRLEALEFVVGFLVALAAIEHVDPDVRMRISPCSASANTFRAGRDRERRRDVRPSRTTPSPRSAPAPSAPAPAENASAGISSQRSQQETR